MAILVDLYVPSLIFQSFAKLSLKCFSSIITFLEGGISHAHLPKESCRKSGPQEKGKQGVRDPQKVLQKVLFSKYINSKSKFSTKFLGLNFLCIIIFFSDPQVILMTYMKITTTNTMMITHYHPDLQGKYLIYKYSKIFKNCQ